LYQAQTPDSAILVVEEEMLSVKPTYQSSILPSIETADTNSCNIEKMEMANPVRDDPTTAWAWHQVLEPTGCGSALMNRGAIADS
jgi:hypothetical protein